MQCSQHIEFAHILLIGPASWLGAAALPSNVEFVAIEPLDGIDAYSTFMLTELTKFIKTSHVLVTQWDGYIAHPDLWKAEFLDYDYIGAPWYHRPVDVSVGNGGFSLRSKRLLDTVKTLTLPPHQPEDSTICIHLRDELSNNHGIRFAPLPLAQQFSCEYGPYRPAFGFHGMHNFAHIMPDQALQAWLSMAPKGILISLHTRKLIKELIKFGRTMTAIKLIHQRSRLIGWTVDQCALLSRAIFQWHPRIAIEKQKPKK